MMEWDDYYQMMASKNKRVSVSDCMKDYKKEAETFYKDWAEAERKGKFIYSDWGSDNRGRE